jgi:hypothetical protein
MSEAFPFRARCCRANAPSACESCGFNRRGAAVGAGAVPIDSTSLSSIEKVFPSAVVNTSLDPESRGGSCSR